MELTERNKYEWVKELNWQKTFPEEYREIIEITGLDKFLAIYDRFKKTPVYFSEKPLILLRQEFVNKYKDKIRDKLIPVGKAAYILGCSERSVYAMMEDSNADNYELFDNKQ